MVVRRKTATRRVHILIGKIFFLLEDEVTLGIAAFIYIATSTGSLCGFMHSNSKQYIWGIFGGSLIVRSFSIYSIARWPKKESRQSCYFIPARLSYSKRYYILSYQWPYQLTSRKLTLWSTNQNLVADITTDSGFHSDKKGHPHDPNTNIIIIHCTIHLQ